MVSILVPIYNFDVRDFVQELSKQASSMEHEILCYDDASSDEFKSINRVIGGIPNVEYVELEINHGRSKIRNVMGSSAKYDNLIIVDCDSSIPSEHYLENYLPHFDKGTVVYGGRAYTAQEPKDPGLILRWKYGVERETVPAADRNKAPYLSFMTNNFLIPKSVLSSVQLDESLVGYGHEDSVLAHSLMSNEVTILHIDNPLVHIGLEQSHEFLDKTLQGLDNLVNIVEKGKALDKNRLYKTYRTLKSIRMLKGFERTYRSQENTIMKNLTSSHPKMRFFDAFKLYHFAQKMN